MIMTDAGVILCAAILVAMWAIGSEHTWLGVVLLIVSIYLILRRSGFFGRRRLFDAESIRAGAEVVDVETGWFGDIGRPHLEVTVTFDDGSWYRDKVSPSSRRSREWGMRKVEPSASDQEVRDVIGEAIAEHERVASEVSSR